MDKLKLKYGQPELKVKNAVTAFLEIRRWLVLPTHGNMYQTGLPDLWISHRSFGSRWVEIKLPGFVGSKFTRAQLEVFPKICNSGSGVWILTADTDEEYQKLFKNCNWWQYLQIWRSSK